MEEEGLCVTRQDVHNILKCYRDTPTTGRRPGDGSPSVISEDVKEIVEAQIRQVLNFKVPCYEID